MISDKIYFLRNENKMTQEELAEKADVSRQAIQKWESGQAAPTIDKLIKLSEIFNVTLDYLCKDLTGDCQRVESGKKYKLNYEKITDTYFTSSDIEYRQSYDEGKDIEQFKDLFMAVKKMPANEYKEKMTDVLFDLVNSLPVRGDFNFIEPNDLLTIKLQREKNIAALDKPSNVPDKIKGGWFGRICGCLLGKPVECIMRADLEKILKRTDNYPLRRYITAEEIAEINTDDITFPIKNRAYSKNFNAMPSDDDTNYMLIALKTLERHGRDFTSDDVADVWLTTQTHNAYCTAEHIAYINFLNGYTAPQSAEYKNVYREWVGAQIRGDIWGYINPANPEKAAEMAWHDARISHVKNGIYGEMFVSAMIAAAFTTDDITKIINIGLGEIPASSRLYKAVTDVIDGYEKGISAKDFFADFRSRWDEKQTYDWCHVISNAEIVTACLLYGNGNYEKSICLAVEQGFDTDCNGATVGSVLGVMLGYEKLPKAWTDQINDTLLSTLSGCEKVSVTDMANKTLEFIEK